MKNGYLTEKGIEVYRQETEEEILRLARSYTPEWKFVKEQPDMGSVIARIFAEQTARTLYEHQKISEKYQKELVRMLGIKPLPPVPSKTHIVLETEGEGDLPAGSRFRSSGEEGDAGFLTEHAIHVTAARLQAVLAVSEKKQNAQMLYTREDGGFPIRLFPNTFLEPYRNELVLYHSFLFDGQEGQVCVWTGENRQSQEAGCEIAYEYLYETDKGLVPVQADKCSNGMVALSRHRGAGALVIRQTRAEAQAVLWPQLSLSASRQEMVPEFLFDGNQELNPNRILPFGEELNTYGICYIGQEEAFRQKGARICLSFTLELESRGWGLAKDSGELKVIQRVPYPDTSIPAADVFVQQVSLEYFNGLGYRKMETEEPVEAIFCDCSGKKKAAISFRVPQDWEPVQVESFEGHVLRIRILQADDCYVRPSVHHYPVITHLKLSYDYGTCRVRPERLVKRQGARMVELTGQLAQGKETLEPISAFSAFPYRGEQMYLGFDRKLTGGPVSLYVDVKKDSNAMPVQVRYEYLGADGFHALQVWEDTEGFQKPGIIRFTTPADMKKGNLEGQEAYWIRMIREEYKEGYPIPEIKGICMNGVRVLNLERSRIQEYYLDEALPGMSFDVAGEQILSARVWVNEIGRIPEKEMLALAKEQPERVRVDYNFEGGIESFFVEWEEREDFALSQPWDRHYILDRKEKKLRFGDGVQVRIPENTADVSFLAEITGCLGEAGNVEAGAVTEAATAAIPSVRVSNPYKAYGGQGMERTERMNRRAGTVLGNAGRLVSGDDYIREIHACSDMTAQAIWRAVKGKLELYVLMKDYKNGPESFLSLKEKLAGYLADRGNAAFGRDDVTIYQPLFLKVSLELWVQVYDWDAFLDEQKYLLQKIRDFFEPVKMGEEPHIGQIPREGQIQGMLASLHMHGRISRYGVTVSYTDENGVHATDLKKLPDHPACVCINGTHSINMIG